MAQSVQYANQQNQKASDSMELMVVAPKPGTTQYTSLNDIEVLTDLRYSSDCNIPGCWGPGSSAKALLTCLNPSLPDSGVIEDEDYRPKATITAWEYSSSLKLGLVVKVDSSEVQAPILVILYILIGTACGIVVLGIAVLAVAAKKMLQTMMDTWERGKQAVHQQKESFETLVAALYPKFASERLLTGESQIVVEVPDVYFLLFPFFLPNLVDYQHFLFVL